MFSTVAKSSCVTSLSTLPSLARLPHVLVALGAQLYDVRRLSEDLMLKRFLHEARLDKSIVNIMEFLKHQEVQYADYWNELYEITNEMEIIT